MPNLTIKSGAITLERDITGKNALHEIMNMMPDGFDCDESLFTIAGIKIDPREFDLSQVLHGDLVINIPPKGIEQIVIALVVALAASVVLAPSTPNPSEGVKESPNNSFFGQTNQIRLDEQEPNLYGENISYPDLVVREGGAWSYGNNQKIIEEVFLITIGDIIFEPPKYELTPLTDITGSSYNVYTPGMLVPRVWGQFNSEFIDGQALPGPNSDDVEEGTVATTTNSGNDLTETGGTLTASTVTPDANWNALFLLAGTQLVPVEAEYTAYVDTGSSCDPTTIIVNGLMTMTQASPGSDYVVNIEGVDGSIPDCSDPGDPKYGTNLKVTELIGASLSVTVPIITSELQVSFDFRAGLRGDAEIRVDVTGDGAPSITEIYNYSANTSRQKFFTEIIPISFTGNVVVTMNRTNNEKEDGTDRVQVSQVATNQYRYNVNYGNRSMLKTERKATEQAIKFKESKVNLKVTRKTITYNESTGLIVPTLSASRSFADAMLHEYNEVNELDGYKLPLDDMYEIEGRIGQLGNFDHTFSDKEQSLGNKLQVMANVARCITTNSGDEWVIYRNEPQSIIKAQFDSRNISADSSEEVSYRGFQEASNDGVKVKWKNPDGNKFEYIYYKVVNGVSTKCIYQGDGTYTPSTPSFPLDIDLIGCYTETQADDRADLECRSLIFIQKTLSTKTLRDGDNVFRGELVRHADYYMDDIASGEIQSSIGDLHTSYSKINLPDGDYFVSYTNEYGESSNPIPCEIIDDYEFLATLPEVYHANGFSIQCGSRYVISTIEQQVSSLYRVNDKIQNSDGTINLELVEYDESIYPELD